MQLYGAAGGMKSLSLKLVCEGQRNIKPFTVSASLRKSQKSIGGGSGKRMGGPRSTLNQKSKHQRLRTRGCVVGATCEINSVQFTLQNGKLKDPTAESEPPQKRRK